MKRERARRAHALFLSLLLLLLGEGSLNPARARLRLSVFLSALYTAVVCVSARKRLLIIYIGRGLCCCSPHLFDGSLENLTFVSLARAHVRGGDQLGKLIDEEVFLGPSSFLVKALVTATEKQRDEFSRLPIQFYILIYRYIYLLFLINTCRDNKKRSALILYYISLSLFSLLSRLYAYVNIFSSIFRYYIIETLGRSL